MLRCIQTLASLLTHTVPALSSSRMDLVSALRSGLPLHLFESLLAAEPAAVATAEQWGRLPVHIAASLGRIDALKALLAAAPASAAACDATGRTPLHLASEAGPAETAALLLLKAPETALLQNLHSSTALHLAAAGGHAAVVRALVAAAPSAASVRDSFRCTPLNSALFKRRFAAARHLLLGPTNELLAALDAGAGSVLPLYADLAASRPLTAEEWGQVPHPCTLLASALPAVLARSQAEARLLMRHLSARQRKRLRTFALCLGRAQQQTRVALPPDLTGRRVAVAGSVLSLI